MDIIVIAIAQIGFTLLVYYASEKGMILYKLYKPIKLYFAKMERNIYRQIRAGKTGAMRRLRRLYFIQKPIYVCPLCMLFWYGSLIFLTLWVTGFVTGNMWIPSMGCAYGLLLGYSYLKNDL